MHTGIEFEYCEKIFNKYSSLSKYLSLETLSIFISSICVLKHFLLVKSYLFWISLILFIPVANAAPVGSLIILSTFILASLQAFFKCCLCVSVKYTGIVITISIKLSVSISDFKCSVIKCLK